MPPGGCNALTRLTMNELWAQVDEFKIPVELCKRKDTKAQQAGHTLEKLLALDCADLDPADQAAVARLAKRWDGETGILAKAKMAKVDPAKLKTILAPLGRVMKIAGKTLAVLGIISATVNPKAWAAEQLGCSEEMIDALLDGDAEIRLGNWPFAPSEGEEVEIGDGHFLWVGMPYTLIHVEDGIATAVIRGVVHSITTTSQPGVVDLEIKDMAGNRNQLHSQKGIWGWDPKRTENIEVGDNVSIFSTN